MTLSTTQELPNRVNTALSNATRGSSTGTDTNDPLFLDHNGSNYVYRPGTANNYLSVPDEAALDITGDIDIRVEVTLTDYTPGSNDNGILLSKRAGSNFSYQLRHRTSGLLNLTTSADGTAQIAADSTVAIPTTDGERTWLRVTMDVDDGAGNRVHKFYTSTDGSTWTQLGATVSTAGATSIHSGTANVEIGAWQTGASLPLVSGCIHRAQIYDGIDGTLVLDINPATDIDTSADADAGQATFTCTTGQTVTVNRSTSGLTTTVVTRPVMCFDGTDDYLQLPASDAPTFTATTGEYTAVVAYRLHNTPAGDERLFSSESADDDGIYLTVDAAQDVKALVGGSTTTATATQAGTFADSTLRVAAFVVDDGTVAAFADGTGLTGTTAITGVGTVTHGSPRIGLRGDSAADIAEGEVFSVLIFEDVALTEAQLSTLSTKLINGDYS